jgi:hypothetical protein
VKLCPKRNKPIVAAIDSIGGSASGDTINKLLTSDTPGKGYYDKQHYLKYWCENQGVIFEREGIPIVIICINQEREQASATGYGPPQKVITGGSATGARSDFAGLLRQNILRERLCDLLTDAFRAMIMRMLGFRTQVVEFVSPDATARNILLRCEFGVKPGQSGVVTEYLNLRDAWQVTPWLETRLSGLLGKHLARYT